MVMQFLMGLNDVYDSAVSNILMMDPLPNFNKVYSMIARIEKQKGVPVTNTTAIEVSVMAAKASSFSKGSSPNNSFPSKKVNRADRYCVFATRMVTLRKPVLRNTTIQIGSKTIRRIRVRNLLHMLTL